LELRNIFKFYSVRTTIPASLLQTDCFATEDATTLR